MLFLTPHAELFALDPLKREGGGGVERYPRYSPSKAFLSDTWKIFPNTITTTCFVDRHNEEATL